MTTKLIAAGLAVCAGWMVAGSASGMVVVGYDDASDPAYNAGWAAGSNGGFGFGPWGQFNLASFNTGDSNTNGSGGGPGINTAGRSWQAQQAVGWGGAVAGRNIGNFGVGDTFEIDVDFGAVTSSGQGVAIFTGLDVVQVQAIGSPATTLLINTNAGSTPTAVPYSDGGYRIVFDYINSNTMDVLISPLALGGVFSYPVTYTGGTGLHDFSLQAFNPTSGQELYANRMRLVTVPEPTMLSAVVGFGWLLARRRGHRV